MTVMPPKLTVSVTAADAQLAEQGKSGGCAFVCAFNRKYPLLKNVEVRDVGISMRDPSTRLRYHWPTPKFLYDWIKGWDHSPDKVQYQLNNPIKLILTKSDAWVAPTRTKTPRQKARDRQSYVIIQERKARRTPKQIEADKQKVAEQRRKRRGT